MGSTCRRKDVVGEKSPKISAELPRASCPIAAGTADGFVQER
jgi:hypothetical protein